MKPGIGAALFAIVLTVGSILYLGRPTPLPPAQIAVLFVFWSLVGAVGALAIQWLRRRRAPRPSPPKKALGRKAGRKR